MNIQNNLLELTSKNVFSVVSHQSVFVAFCDSKMRFNTAFSSPLRKDNRPSFVIYERGFFIDFASGEKGDSISFVMKLNNIDFNSALCAIVEKLNVAYRFFIRKKDDFVVKIAPYNNPKASSIDLDGCKIDVKVRQINKDDLEYWKKYNIIGEAEIRSFNIVAISHFFLNKKMYIAEKLSYAFIEKKDNVVTKKIYQPNSRYMKWINNNNGSVWELWEHLPEKGKDLIITSSRKDAASIIKTLKIPSTSLQSESVMPKESVMKELFSRFENIYILYDNDYSSAKNWGQLSAKKIIEKYPKLIGLKINECYGAKDFSDFVSIHGVKKTKETIIPLIKKAKDDSNKNTADISCSKN
jgi:CHC2 zinc finger